MRSLDLNKTILIDDNEHFLKNVIGTVGFTINAKGKSIKNIVETIKINDDKIKYIVANANLKLTSENKRFDRIGLKILQEIAYFIFSKKFIVYSFEDYNSINKSSDFAKRFLEADDVEFIDVFDLIRIINKKRGDRYA